MGKQKKPRRRKYDRDNRLRLSGSVWQEREVRERVALWIKALDALVRILPTHKVNRQGRQQALMIRLGIGVMAAALVSYGKDQLIFGLLGVVVALSSVVVPISDVRQRRWRRGLATRGNRSRAAYVKAPAQLEFDGRKASLRLDGKVWRSLRPFEVDCEITLSLHDGILCLALEATDDKKTTSSLYFTTEYQAFRADLTPPQRAEPPPADAMHLTEDAFVQLHEAFIHRLWRRPG